jgi:hypothetical protein
VIFLESETAPKPTRKRTPESTVPTMPMLSPEAKESMEIVNKLIQGLIVISLTTAEHNCDCETCKLVRELVPNVKKLVMLGFQRKTEEAPAKTAEEG